MSLEIGPDFGNYALKGIEEIAFPPPIPWWPVAPGWRWLGLMLLVGLGWLAYRRFRRWQRDAYRRDALRRLAEIERSSASWQEVVSALPLLLKAVALDAYPRGEVAALSGAAWLDFLDSSCAQCSFAGHNGHALLAAAYQDASEWRFGEREARALRDAVRIWIRDHARGETGD